MHLQFARRYSLSLGVVGLLLLMFSTYLAFVNYPLQPISSGDSFGLALVVIFPLAIGAGLLFAFIVWREWLGAHESVWWLLVYPLGACVGISVPTIWLLLSPNYSANPRIWYGVGVVAGGIVGVTAEMVNWNRNGD